MFSAFAIADSKSLSTFEAEDFLLKDNMSMAIDILSFSKKSSASNVLKLLESAIANAENNKGLDIDDLFVSEIKVDESFILKRIQARARGRADRIQKRSCHVNITLGSEKN